jgi:hypothetical protein
MIDHADDHLAGAEEQSELNRHENDGKQNADERNDEPHAVVKQVSDGQGQYHLLRKHLRYVATFCLSDRLIVPAQMDSTGLRRGGRPMQGRAFGTCAFKQTELRWLPETPCTARFQRASRPPRLRSTVGLDCLADRMKAPDQFQPARKFVINRRDRTGI